MNHSLEVGVQARVTRSVTQSDLASSLSTDPADQFPEVFATSRMIALMELAAAQVLRPLLADGQLSVGVTVDVMHSAPTSVGEAVSTTATYKGQEGKLFIFDVTAEDGAGEIGRGTHKRAIISTSRLVEGAERRRRQSQGLQQ